MVLSQQNLILGRTEGMVTPDHKDVPFSIHIQKYLVVFLRLALDCV